MGIEKKSDSHEIPQTTPSSQNEVMPDEIGVEEYINACMRRSIRVVNTAFEECVEKLEASQAAMGINPKDSEYKKLREKQGALKRSLEWSKAVLKNMAPLVYALSIDLYSAGTERPQSREDATIQLQSTGITDERKAAYLPHVNDFLYAAIAPFEYKSLWHLAKQLPSNVITGRETMQAPLGNGQTAPVRKSEHLDREDAWRFYLGLPQQNDTFGISEYRPQNSTEDKYYYKINNWFKKFSRRYPRNEQKDFKPIKSILEEFDNERKAMEASFSLDEFMIENPLPGQESSEKGRQKQKERLVKETKIFQQRESVVLYDGVIPEPVRMPGLIDDPDPEKRAEIYRGLGVMGNFTLSKGRDENGYYISYYDRWDLKGATEHNTGFFGKPFEIYDRIYYDPQTFEVIRTGS